MDLAQQLVEAMKAELQRQAEDGALTLDDGDPTQVAVNGRIDLETLAQALVGHVAGGP